MEPSDEAATREAAACLAAMNEMLHPRSKQEMDEIYELRQSGVSEEHIETLYPLTGAAYASSQSLSALTPSELSYLDKRMHEAVEIDGTFVRIAEILPLLLKDQYLNAGGEELEQIADICLALRTVPLSELIILTANPEWDRAAVQGFVQQTTICFRGMQRLGRNPLTSPHGEPVPAPRSSRSS